MRNDWKDLFLSSAGRVSRAPFLVASIFLIAVTALYEDTVGRVMHWVTGWFVYPVLVFCAASVLSKRLHDRGRSGWWSALVLLAVLVVWPCPTGFVDFLFSIVLLWTVVELALLPGMPAANQFGPNPLDPLRPPEYQA
jgi:uncharacterized membrane protein YhaH (DUF805 family)